MRRWWNQALPPVGSEPFWLGLVLAAAVFGSSLINTAHHTETSAIHTRQCNRASEHLMWWLEYRANLGVCAVSSVLCLPTSLCGRLAVLPQLLLVVNLLTCRVLQCVTGLHSLQQITAAQHKLSANGVLEHSRAALTNCEAEVRRGNRRQTAVDCEHRHSEADARTKTTAGDGVG